MTAEPAERLRESATPMPAPRGVLSSLVAEALKGPPADGRRVPTGEAAREAGRCDPLGEDLQLALHTCYELHYRGFAGVDPEWEWQPGLLELRGVLEHAFQDTLRDRVAGGTDLDAELDALLVEPVDGSGIAHVLQSDGTWEQMREFFAHRSVYHLKEADPQAWVIPRLRGRAKAALVAVEFDEFGGGRAERVHARLFADLLAAAGLDARYGHYVDLAPAETLATVNLVSYLGLHRARRAALAGHFAAAEIATAPSATRMVQALERLGAPAACRHFYAEHIEADAVHEQVMRRDVLGGLLEDEPGLRGDVVFGIQAANLLEDGFADRLSNHWRRGTTSLRRRLPAVREPSSDDT